MLIMETIAKIRRLYYGEGKKLKAIARELRLSKNTVKKAIRSEKTVFEYRRNHIHYRVLGPHIEQLNQWLEADEQEPKRRRRTATKLYEDLQAQGFSGRYETVNAYVKKYRGQKAQSVSQVFIPQTFAPGEAFQFDWSEEEIELAGEVTRIKVAHIRLCYSRYFLMIAYPNEQLEMVMDAHDKAFAFFGGVCRQGTYDNMKTAVKQILVGKAREFNPRFLQMASHHCFDPVACTPSAGWEKGQVENQVGIGREHFFTPLQRVKSLEELNEQLAQRCQAWAMTKRHPDYPDKTVMEMYQIERAFFIDYRGSFNGYKIQHSVVSPSSCIMADTNHYSVDCHYVGKPVEVRLYAREIVVTCQGQEISRHPRSFKRYQRIYNPWHYLPALERKPGALRNGAPFKEWILPEPLMTLKVRFASHPDKDKQFASLLLLIPSAGLSQVTALCREALSIGVYDVNWIKKRLEKETVPPEQPYYPNMSRMPESCQDYDALSQGGHYAA